MSFVTFFASLFRNLSLVACLFLGLAMAGAEESPLRAQLPLLDGWRFHRGAAEGAHASGCDDGSWESVTLPHTWNAKDGQDGGGYFRGDGWYRRHLRIPAGWVGRQVYLQFDGANRIAEVFLNGQKLGLHKGGFARFRFDITAALDFGADNLLAVRVSNAEHDNLIPVLGDFTLFGGLYRGVSLLATDRVQIETLDHASEGVFIRPETVTREEARMAVKVELANHEASDLEGEVRLSVRDAEGCERATLSEQCTLAAHAVGAISPRFTLVQPRLWDGLRDPHLYRLRAELWVGGRLRDVVEQSFGVRFFTIEPAQGFFLNGHIVDLRGANRHQDRAGHGWAICPSMEREDMDLMLEMGSNMARTSHYQQSQFWYDLADQRGVVLWTEIPFVYEVLDVPELFANAKEQLRELIRQNFNHPSILFWGIGNETFVRDTKVTPADTNDRLLKELAAVAREEDPNRMSVYASNGDASESRAAYTDAVGFNHYFGWYHDRPEDFVAWLDRQHAEHPLLRIGMSEYGAGANPLQHEEPAHRPEPLSQWHPEEWQARFHEVHWQALAQRPWVWCKLVWCMFDVASDGRNEGGTPGINDKGLVTLDRRTRKDAFYFYKANWSSEPVLYIAGSRFTPRIQPITTVKVYSNAPKVELWVNGESQGTREAANHLFLWENVTLRPGENTIVAKAQRAGRPLDARCTWMLKTAEENGSRQGQSP